MKIKEISFRRVFNLGNYETVALELRADVNDNENIIESLDELKNVCDKYYNSKKKGN